jgi:hypothetical protein
MKQLYLSLKEAGLMFKEHTEQGEVDFILVETYENGNKTSVDVKGNPTYEALSGSHTFKLGDKQYTMTAEEMGYQKYFEQWKEQGLFNY